MHSAITGEPKNEEQIKADSVQGAAAPKQISTIIQPCSLQRDSITENKASVYVSGLVWIKRVLFFFVFRLETFSELQPPSAVFKKKSNHMCP